MITFQASIVITLADKLEIKQAAEFANSFEHSSMMFFNKIVENNPDIKVNDLVQALKPLFGNEWANNIIMAKISDTNLAVPIEFYLHDGMHNMVSIIKAVRKSNDCTLPEIHKILKNYIVELDNHYSTCETLDGIPTLKLMVHPLRVEIVKEALYECGAILVKPITTQEI